MRTDIILQVYSQYIQIAMSKLLAEFSETYDSQRFEAGVRKLTDELQACLLAVAINEMLSSKKFLERPKVNESGFIKK